MSTKKAIIDVAHPDSTEPSSTAKPVIVTNRPIMQDPMVVADKPSEETVKTDEQTRIAANNRRLTIKPLTEALEETKEQKSADAEPQAPEATAVPAKPEEKPPQEKPPEPQIEENVPAPTAQPHPGDQAKDADAEAKEAEEAAARELELQKLVASKKYYLPINSVEKRRTKREIILGAVFSILLVLAWLDIALDAGLVHLGGMKALTHFFSS